MFSQLYISCSVRHGNIDEFFQDENMSYALALALGQLCQRTQSDITRCLENVLSSSDDARSSAAIILDGAVIVNLLYTQHCKDISEICTQYFSEIS